MFEVTVHSEEALSGTLATEWENLIRGSMAEVFSHPAWYNAYRVAEGIREIGIVCARQNGELVGLLPLARCRNDYRGLFFPVVAPFARGDFQPPIIRPDLVAELLPQLLDKAIQHFKHPGTIWWPFIPNDDPSLPVLRDYFLRRGMPTFEETEVAPRLRVNGLSFAELEKTWSSNHRIDVRRRRKRLAETGAVSLWTPSTLEEAEALLSEFFEVHDEKWLSQGYPGKFQSPRARRLFTECLRRMWGRGMYFTTVRCGDVHVSYHFGFLSGGWIQWYRPAYRSEYFGFSPGKIHVALLLEEACRNGWNGLDFLLGEEPYKQLWSNETGRAVSIWAGSSSRAPSFWWFSKGKPYFRRRFVGSLFKAKAWYQNLLRRGMETKP
ncbi:MAG: GNAT family N-acetyltransferase [Bryobacterales bacterium]|nr:GNAT family N-acetyltransferase [Bryobacterales bacterium]